MLKINNLQFAYDTTPILRNLNLNLPQKSHYAIIGPNGCGKTTLLKCIAGLLPYKGSITLQSTSNNSKVSEIKTLPPQVRAKTIALMTQNAKVYFPYTIWETVALGRYAHTSGVFHRLAHEDFIAISEALEKVGLLSKKDTLISKLSGGQLQRVFLARALVQDPDILLLDEPTNHLDLKYQIQLLDFIKKWGDESGKTIFSVLHDLNLVQAFSEYVILLHEGNILTQGPTQTVLTQKYLYTAYDLDIQSWMIETLKKWELSY
jgi:iron complex transport system ATP-binding protein